MADIQSIAKDPDFQKLHPTEQVKVLSHVDKDFAGLPATEQMKVLGSFGQQQAPTASSPQELAAQAMRSSGIPAGGQVAPIAPKVNMQQQSGAYPGAVANAAQGVMGQYGTATKTIGGDLYGATQGIASLAKNTLRDSNGTMGGLQMAMARHMTAPIVQSAQNPMDSSADTTGRIIGANVEGIRDAAGKEDYTALGAHSVLPLVSALSAYRGIKGAGPQITANDLGIPTRAHASKLFSEVGDAIGDTPIDAGGPAGDAALRIQDLSKRGATMPKVVSDFIKRMTDPTKGPLTYEEARDFASNASNLTWKETSTMRPKMKKAVGDFAGKINDAVANTAEQFEAKAKYSEAMGEYADASKWRNRAALLGKVAEKYAPYVAGGIATKKLIDGR